MKYRTYIPDIFDLLVLTGMYGEPCVLEQWAVRTRPSKTLIFFT